MHDIVLERVPRKKHVAFTLNHVAEHTLQEGNFAGFTQIRRVFIRRRFCEFGRNLDLLNARGDSSKLQLFRYCQECGILNH
jgi:hypothetical protein